MLLTYLSFETLPVASPVRFVASCMSFVISGAEFPPLLCLTEQLLLSCQLTLICGFMIFSGDLCWEHFFVQKVLCPRAVFAAKFGIN